MIEHHCTETDHVLVVVDPDMSTLLYTKSKRLPYPGAPFIDVFGAYTAWLFLSGVFCIRSKLYVCRRNRLTALACRQNIMISRSCIFLAPMRVSPWVIGRHTHREPIFSMRRIFFCIRTNHDRMLPSYIGNAHDRWPLRRLLKVRVPPSQQLL